MPSLNHLAFVLCLLPLFVVLPVQAQEGERVSCLQDAETIGDVYAWLDYHMANARKQYVDPKKYLPNTSDLWLAAGNRALEIAKDDQEKEAAYSLKANAFYHLILGEVEGIEEAERKLEALLDDIVARAAFENAEAFAIAYRYELFIRRAERTVHTPESFAAFMPEFEKWLVLREGHIFISIVHSAIRIAEQSGVPEEQFLNDLAEFIQSPECLLPERRKEEFMIFAGRRQFELFQQRAMGMKVSPENFTAFLSELKEWIDRNDFPISRIALMGHHVAHRHGVPAEQFIAKLVEYILSPESKLPVDEKERIVAALKDTLRLAYGKDIKLYGKMLDGEDFDWESLRGKYVLIKFTATWCIPCRMEVPGMLEAYEKYHSKGLEIVSVYIWERGVDPVADVKKHVEDEKLPWIIISEALTERAGKPNYRVSYAVLAVPTMILVDKDGKVILMEARGERLQTKLTEIFE